MKSILARIRNEPVLLTGLIMAIVYAAIEFGLELTAGQLDAIKNVMIAFGLVIARQLVSPAKKAA